jgi:NAD(P)-dependent dehydrogenase (short-subunit alcohol dehydrogenase family)
VSAPAPRRLDGRVAIVTGAGRGIGAGIARRFAREGAHVVLTQRTADEGERLAAEIRDSGGSCLFEAGDIARPADVERLMQRAIDRYGRLDVLCANAGVGLRKTVVSTTMDEYDRVMDANVRGVFLCMQHAIPEMIRGGGGSVIVVASVASFVAFPLDAAYCASKGAVLMLTRQTAFEYAPQNVRINAICPGFIVTPMLDQYCAASADPEQALRDVIALHPMGRLGTPDDVAGAAAFLASDDATWITGAALPVDGGLLSF